MATEVKLPALGESVTEGTVTQWLKSVGDTVAVDEPLLEVSTDKVDTEIPSPVAGTLLEIKAAEDETIEVGAVLAVIGDEGEPAGDAGQSGESGQTAESGQTGEGEQQPADAESGEAEVASSQESDEQGRPEDDAGTQESAPQEPEAPEPAAATAESPEQSQRPSSSDDSSDGSGGSRGGDSTPVTLPALGESVTEGTVTQWLKSVGDTVAVDEPLLEVSTDKVDTEIPSPVAGTLLEIKAAEDETVEVGAVLGLIGSGTPSSGGGDSGPEQQEPQTEASSEQEQAQQEQQPEPEPASEPEPQPERQPRAVEQEQGPAAEDRQPVPNIQAAPATTAARSPASDGGDRSSTNGSGDRSYVTPLVRKLAAQHNVDLAGLTGTGVGGRIRKQDVLAAAESAKQASAASAEASAEPTSARSPEPSPLRGKTEKLSRLRKVIADRMVESLHVSAQLTTVVEVDVTAIGQLRAKHKDAFEQREGVKLSFLPFFARAAVDALKLYPQVNASIDTEAGTVTYHDGEHLGIAVDTERGLLVPVIRNAGDLSIAGIARKIADLAARTRDSKINPDELSGGTFTLTNTGSRGALFDTPIINQPQVGILGTGAVVKRPVVISDERLGETIAVRQMVYLALTYDHRLVDGADAARFLTTIKQRLEEANFESELGG
jgi:pyruvate dehydrogenase E2 component (dihydrolipoamide acetyltransferase)